MQVRVNGSLIRLGVPILADSRVLLHATVILSDVIIVISLIVSNNEPVEQRDIIFVDRILHKALIDIHPILGVASLAELRGY